MTSNREQELVLCGRETDRRRLLFAPAFKESHAGSNVQKSSVGLVGKFHFLKYSIVLR